MFDERLVRFRPRAILIVIGVVLATAIALQVVWATRSVIIWVLIAMFLAMALNPAVEFLVRRGMRRGAAVGIVFVGAILVIVGIAATFVPILVREVNDFADAVPGYIDDVTRGQGRLGFLEREYQIVEKARDAIEKSGAGGVLGLSSTALTVTMSILNAVIAVVTIAFLTLFMLLEGPAWVQRIYSLIGEPAQPRWRKVGGNIYRTVGGYVTGNLAISLIAGVVSTSVLLVLGVPYAVALGLIVGLLDLIPLAGAMIAAVIVSAVGFLHSTTAGIVLVIFFVLYQQLENHVLQPLVYGRTVQLSPLVVLVAVLMGAKLAGVIGALGAIPVAGAIQVIVVDWLDHRRQKILDPPGPPPSALDLPSRAWNQAERVRGSGSAGSRALPRALRQSVRGVAARLEHRRSVADGDGCAGARAARPGHGRRLWQGRSCRGGVRHRGCDRRPVRRPAG